MWRRSGLVVLLAVLILGSGAVAGGAPLAGVHGNHVTVNPQVVAGDRVVVESYFSTTGGFLVIHADDDGEPGRVLGHEEALQGKWVDLTVPADTADLPTEGSASLWAVLHRDDGDGEFHPDDDPPIGGFGAVAGSTFRVRRGADPVAVVATSQGDRRSNGTVVLDRVALASPGYVVVRATDGDGSGEVLGVTRLDPGTHRDVYVDLDPAAFAAQPSSFEVRAVVHAADGDGSFDPDTDRPVTVGGDPVGAVTTVIKAEDGSAIVNTPTSTTTTAVPGDGDGTTDDRGGSDGAPDGTEGDDRGLPGFGAGIAAVAVLVALCVRRLR